MKLRLNMKVKVYPQQAEKIMADLLLLRLYMVKRLILNMMDSSSGGQLRKDFGHITYVSVLRIISLL